MSNEPPPPRPNRPEEPLNEEQVLQYVHPDHQLQHTKKRARALPEQKYTKILGPYHMTSLLSALSLIAREHFQFFTTHNADAMKKTYTKQATYLLEIMHTMVAKYCTASTVQQQMDMTMPRIKHLMIYQAKLLYERINYLEDKLKWRLPSFNEKPHTRFLTKYIPILSQLSLHEFDMNNILWFDIFETILILRYNTPFKEQTRYYFNSLQPNLSTKLTILHDAEFIKQSIPINISPIGVSPSRNRLRTEGEAPQILRHVDPKDFFTIPPSDEEVRRGTGVQLDSTTSSYPLIPDIAPLPPAPAATAADDEVRPKKVRQGCSISAFRGRSKKPKQQQVQPPVTRRMEKTILPPPTTTTVGGDRPNLADLMKPRLILKLKPNKPPQQQQEGEEVEMTPQQPPPSVSPFPLPPPAEMQLENEEPTPLNINDSIVTVYEPKMLVPTTSQQDEEQPQPQQPLSLVQTSLATTAEYHNPLVVQLQQSFDTMMSRLDELNHQRNVDGGKLSIEKTTWFSHSMAHVYTIMEQKTLEQLQALRLEDIKATKATMDQHYAQVATMQEHFQAQMAESHAVHLQSIETRNAQNTEEKRRLAIQTEITNEQAKTLDLERQRNEALMIQVTVQTQIANLQQERLYMVQMQQSNATTMLGILPAPHQNLRLTAGVEDPAPSIDWAQNEEYPSGSSSQVMVVGARHSSPPQVPHQSIIRTQQQYAGLVPSQQTTPRATPPLLSESLSTTGRQRPFSAWNRFRQVETRTQFRDERGTIREETSTREQEESQGYNDSPTGMPPPSQVSSLTPPPVVADTHPPPIQGVGRAQSQRSTQTTRSKSFRFTGCTSPKDI